MQASVSAIGIAGALGNTVQMVEKHYITMDLESLRGTIEPTRNGMAQGRNASQDH